MPSENWPVQCKYLFFSLNVTSQINAAISEFAGFVRVKLFKISLANCIGEVGQGRYCSAMLF